MRDIEIVHAPQTKSTLGVVVEPLQLTEAVPSVMGRDVCVPELESAIDAEPPPLPGAAARRRVGTSEPWLLGCPHPPIAALHQTDLESALL